MKQRNKAALIFIALLLFFQFAIAQKNTINLNWKLAPQSDVAVSADKITDPGFNTNGWINAVVPGTVFYSYVVAGKEANPDYAENIYKVDKAKYNKPYWYRAEFAAINLPAGKRQWLNFNGIHKIAEIYFNGKHIGTLKGLMERGKYDVTELLDKNKPNVIAILITPPLNDPEHKHGLANWEAPTYLSSASWDWMPEIYRHHNLPINRCCYSK